MAISSLFAKFKGLGPFLVVGAAVLVTFKLLTTKTPPTEDSFIVKVEEDIKTDEYQDNIEIPEPEPTPPEPKEEIEQENQPEEKSEEKGTSEEEEETKDSNKESEDEAEEKEDKEEEKEKEEKPKTTPRMFKQGDKVSEILKNLLMPPKK